MNWDLTFVSQQPYDCAFLRGIAEKWVRFTSVTESRRLGHQFQQMWLQVVMSSPDYAYPQSLMAGGLLQYPCQQDA